MESSTILAILKICFIVLFVLIVMFVGTLPLRLATFKRNQFLKSMGTTFAGALFVNVAIVHILPQSADSIEDYLKNGDEDAEVFPLANLLVIIGFLITIFFTRIVATHSHDQDHHHEHLHEPLDPKKEKPEDEVAVRKQNNSTIISNQNEEDEDEDDEKDEKDEESHQDSYFLTVAMYFHTVFEGIAIGVQNTIGGFLSTAIAIAFHKWADALSMGIHYRTRNVPKKTAYGLIIGQAALNAIAIGFGWAITSLGDFVEAIFLSISAGTFLAISTMQMLGDQLHRQDYKWHKFGIMIFSTIFISAVWFFQNAIFSNTDQS